MNKYIKSIIGLSIFYLALSCPFSCADYAAGQLIVKFDSSLTHQQYQALIKSFGLNIVIDQSSPLPFPKQLYLVGVPCGQEGMWLNVFSNLKYVEYAEPDLITYATAQGHIEISQQDPTSEVISQYGKINYITKCVPFKNDVKFDMTTSVLTIPSLILSNGQHYEVTVGGPYKILTINKK